MFSVGSAEAVRSGPALKDPRSDCGRCVNTEPALVYRRWFVYRAAAGLSPVTELLSAIHSFGKENETQPAAQWTRELRVMRRDRNRPETRVA